MCEYTYIFGQIFTQGKRGKLRRTSKARSNGPDSFVFRPLILLESHQHTYVSKKEKKKEKINIFPRHLSSLYVHVQIFLQIRQHGSGNTPFPATIPSRCNPK